MVSFFAEVKIFRDYSQAFWLKLRPFFVVFLLLTGRCYEAEIGAVLFSLDALSDGIIVGRIQNFQFLVENHGL